MSTDSDTPSAQSGNDDQNLPIQSDPNSPRVGGELNEARLVQVFEQLLVRHEEEQLSTGPTLTPEQVSLALQQQQEESRQAHELRMLKEKHRHEALVLRQQEKTAQEKNELGLREDRLKFLPKLGLFVVVAGLSGTAVILLILLAFNAKDQIGIVLGLISGLIGGWIAGFASAKSMPQDGKPTPQPKRKKTGS